MPEERAEKKKVERVLIRSSEVESHKMSLISRKVGLDTALRSSKVAEAKMKARKEAKNTE